MRGVKVSMEAIPRISARLHMTARTGNRGVFLLLLPISFIYFYLIHLFCIRLSSVRKREARKIKSVTGREARVPVPVPRWHRNSRDSAGTGGAGRRGRVGRVGRDRKATNERTDRQGNWMNKRCC